MTKTKAIERAREESRKGYVQHVNVRAMPRGGDFVGMNDYEVSDWHAGAATAYSFENGRELSGRC